jgi:hypothetical protein
MANDDDQGAIEEFREAVNMTAKELTDWLKTDESKAVGQKKGSSESVGHHEGHLLITLLDKKQADYNEHDVRELRRITGYVHRHLAQRPHGDVTDTPWRYSLMNWGHDPQKQ